MSNYNKSFNFRNGVQVDEDDLIVRGSLVGIGTTIPRSELDVRGNVDVTGLITSTNLFVSGIATFTDVQIGTGITIYGNAGIISATFYGDGSNLGGVPTSQWVDINPGTGVTSIYAIGNVGIATSSPTNTFQVGGRVEEGHSGVGISSDGGIYASGIITATSFVGSGANLTTLNASQITTGTISEDRLPENLNVTGIATVATLEVTQINNAGIATISDLKLGQTNISGIATVGFATVSSAYINNLTAGIATVTTLSATSSISAGSLVGLQRVVITGIATVGLVSASDVYVSGVTTTSSLDATTGTIANLTASNSASLNNTTVTNLNVTGITTVGMMTSPTAHIGVATIRSIYATQMEVGVTTSTTAYAGSVRLGVGANNEVDTASGTLVLDSADGLVNVDDNLVVTGYTYLTGITTIQDSIVPELDQDAALGSASLRFSDAYIDNVRIGVGSDNEISTGSGDLKLNPNSKAVQVVDRFKVSGETYLTGITTVQNGLVPASDTGTFLGQSAKAFSEAHIDGIRVGVAGSTVIDTRGGSLTLNSEENKVIVSNDLTVNQVTNLSDNLYVGPDGNDLYVNSTANTIGIGTSAPSSDIEVTRNGNLNVELVSETGTATLALAQTLGIGNDSGTISYANGDLSISNKSDTGSINLELAAGTGINTNAFFKINNKGTSIVSVGDSGVTGINKAFPEHALDVNGNLVVGGNAKITGIVTIGSGVNEVTFGAGDATINGNLIGNVYSDVGFSTFRNVDVEDVVSIGATLSVTGVGIGSFQNGVVIGTSNELVTDGIGISPILNVSSGDLRVAGSSLFSNTNSKVGIATTGFLSDDRPSLAAEDSNFPGVNYGVLQIRGDMSVTGYSGGASIFVAGPVGNTTAFLIYKDNRILDDQNYQYSVGINTHVPRSCLDLGASASPLILPTMDAARKQYMIANPPVSRINVYNASTGDANISGSLLFNTSTGRAELGIGNTGVMCGIATLTYNGSDFAAFLPPKLSTGEITAMTNSGIPDGAIIYNSSTDKLQLRAAGAWVNLN